MAADPPAITFRVAGLADIPAIVAVQARGWRASYRGLVEDAYLDALPLQDWIESWRAHFFGARGDTACLLVEVEGRAVGFASCGAAAEAADVEASTGEIHTIYVDVAYQGQGLGRRLMDWGLEHLRSRGYSEAVLWVLEGNRRGTRFYEAGGWTADGARATDCWGATSITRVRYRRRVPAPLALGNP